MITRRDARLAGLNKGRAVAIKVRQAKAREAYSDLVPSITALKAEGLSFRALADRLTQDGHLTVTCSGLGTQCRCER